MGNVSALEKGSGKAEKFKGEDDKQKERIAAKNGLESFIFNLKSSLDNEEIKSKLSSKELSGAQSALDGALKWMDANQLAEKEEFEDKQKELERMSKPIMSKIYGGGEAGESCGQQQQRSTSNSNGGAGPTIEEVD